MAVRTEPRLPLNRDRILHAALELVDKGGIQSLTMRKLGQALGFEAMSLYNHVANKNDVLDGILDLVLGESEPPQTGAPWDTAIRASAVSVHQALLRHPWACTLLMSADHLRPARLRYMDALLGALRESGFSVDTTFHAYHVLDGHIFGFTFWQTSHSYTPAEVEHLVATFETTISADEYPYLHEHGRQHFDEGPHREVSAFEVGLDFILDGLRKIHGAPESPG